MKLTLIFPNRGNLPPEQEGYERDPGNPRIFRMKWLPCGARMKGQPCRGCPEPAIPTHCSYFNKEVDQNVCNTCGGVEAATKRESSSVRPSAVHSEGILLSHDAMLSPELPIMPASEPEHEEVEQLSDMHSEEDDVVVR